MVTPVWLEAPPACTNTGTAEPGGIPVGICTLIWVTPATRPGAPIAEITVAPCPATAAVTFCDGCGALAPLGFNAPSTPAGEVTPKPVANSEIVLPGLAGLLALFKLPL